MSNNKISIREWLKCFEAGEFDSADVSTQIAAGWYDWFCNDTTLVRKTAALGKKLKMIADSELINIDTTYVFFKNNCPMIGSLYDDFRICDIKTGDVVWTITPKSGHKIHEGKGEVWGSINGFTGPVITGSWKEIKAWFKEATQDTLLELQLKSFVEASGINDK